MTSLLELLLTKRILVHNKCYVFINWVGRVAAQTWLQNVDELRFKYSRTSPRHEARNCLVHSMKHNYKTQSYCLL